MLHDEARHPVRVAARADGRLDQVALRVLHHQPGRVAVAQLQQRPHLLRRQHRLEAQLGNQGPWHGDNHAVGVEGLAVGLHRHPARAPPHQAHRLAQAHVERPGDGLGQEVVAAADLAVALAPGELHVQLLGVGKPERGRGRGLRDRGQQDLGLLRDVGPPQPLRD